jgi:hypothetical protein
MSTSKAWQTQKMASSSQKSKPSSFQQITSKRKDPKAQQLSGTQSPLPEPAAQLQVTVVPADEEPYLQSFGVSQSVHGKAFLLAKAAASTARAPRTII